ncbi:MAG TPA: DUF6807 family protein [Acidobacteriota bacterium]|jgi:hypothetical protein
MDLNQFTLYKRFKVLDKDNVERAAKVIVIFFAFFAFFAVQSQSKPSAPSKGFRFEAVSDKSLGLWEGDRPVFVYNHGVISKPAVEGARDRSSYIHPIYGLDAEVLTDDFPKDHVHHRGLYWAWPHIKIADKEYDLWSMSGIRHQFQRWLAREIKANIAALGIENGWFVGDRQVLQEKVWIRAHPASSEERSIEVEFTWTPIDRPVTLWGAEGKSYGGLALRFGPRSRTIITIPAGRTSEDLVVTRLPWADLSGDLKGANKLSGMAVFVDPAHPDYPPTWMTRHYGMLAVGWPGVTPQTFPPGKSVSCRYRIWIHRGAPEAAEIQRAYDAYRAGIQRAGKK